MGYLMPKLSREKNSSDTTKPIAGGIKELIPIQRVFVQKLKGIFNLFLGDCPALLLIIYWHTLTWFIQ